MVGTTNERNGLFIFIGKASGAVHNVCRSEKVTAQNALPEFNSLGRIVDVNELA
jgi:hypothetical protein